MNPPRPESAPASSESRSVPVSSGGSDLAFQVGLWVIGGSYALLVAALVLVDLFYTTPGHVLTVLARPAIRDALLLSLFSCTLATGLGMLVAVPMGYAMSRHRFRGRELLDALFDIPNVLPPLVLGLCLLILFQCWPFRLIAPWVVYQVPAVVLAHFVVATAFAIRMMRATFDHIDPRHEDVALTLGCSRREAFFRITLPEARRGILAAATLAWSRCLGEFGPLLVFAGVTRHKTEVLSTSVFLELSVGDLPAAVAVAVLMVVTALVVLVLTRAWGYREPVF